MLKKEEKQHLPDNVLIMWKKRTQARDINIRVYKEMIQDCDEIKTLIIREKDLDKIINSLNKDSVPATLLQTILGIAPINASILSIKPMKDYEEAKDFAASLGLVPKQHTRGCTPQVESSN